jgi:hypothetical protein
VSYESVHFFVHFCYSIENSLSPRWITTFDLDYELSQNTRINVGVWDEVKRGKKENKPMGSALFEVGEVLGARGNTKAKKLRNGGTLFARITTAPIQDMGIFHLKLQGYKLKNLDGFFGKSDPLYVVSSKVIAAGGLTWQPVYRSQPIMNNLNPIWPPCTIDVARLCEGDLNKPILIEVFDWDKKGKNILIGKFETSIQGLISSVVEENVKAPNTSKAFTTVKMRRDTGQIIVTAAYLEGFGPPGAANATQHATVSSVPIVQPQGPSAMATTTTPVTYDTPSFAEALDRPPPSFQTTATMLTAAAAISSNPNLSNHAIAPIPYIPSAPMESPMITANTIYPQQQMKNRPKFTDYLTGGCELELTIAIDFTGSNGDPRKPGTLHYRYPDNTTLNDYEKAITAVGGVLARYDYDQKFSVFGFGAKYNGIIHHCFQVGNKEELDGLSGVLEAYRNVFRTGLTMSGPTVFSEVIDFAAATSRSKQEESLRIGKQSYKVLLILTDGEVTDIEQTKRAIRAASDAPLSIVIVGIGNANFGAMQDLDDFQDDSPGRDIVQFVPFTEHVNDRSSLTRATLEEIPDQMVDYFTQRGMAPLPPIRQSQLSLAADDPTDEDIDLSIDVNGDGEISLANYDNIPVYDDSRYNTYNDYSTIAPIPPPMTATTTNYNNGYTQFGQIPSQPYVAQVQPVMAQQQQQQQQQQSNYFHVQVPYNCSPGMQIQICHPKTQQVMIVTIPPGIPPGGTFLVPL